MLQLMILVLFFFFNDTATTEIYTLSLHDTLPICSTAGKVATSGFTRSCGYGCRPWTARCSPGSTCWTHTKAASPRRARSEEHTSELQSRQYLVCRLLLEKKKHIYAYRHRLHSDVT